MPRFSGEYRETFVVDAPIDRAKAHFADLPTVAANYGGLVSHQIHDEHEITFVLEPKSEKGVTFNGRYRGRYEFTSADTLEWKTVDTRNMWSTGRARFVAMGDKTRVEFTQHVETEMEVNKLLAKLIGPIVSREINAGTKGYIERMRRSI